MIKLLMLLKLGIYAPSQSNAPFPAWFYLSSNVWEQKCKNPAGMEIGISPEFIKRETIILGKPAEKYEIFPAFFLGFKKAIDEDLDVAAGAKYNEGVGGTGGISGYLGISLKFKSIIKKQQQINSHPEESARYYYSTH